MYHLLLYLVYVHKCYKLDAYNFCCFWICMSISPRSLVWLPWHTSPKHFPTGLQHSTQPEASWTFAFSMATGTTLQCLEGCRHRAGQRQSGGSVEERKKRLSRELSIGGFGWDKWKIPYGWVADCQACSGAVVMTHLLTKTWVTLQSLSWCVNGKGLFCSLE